MFYSGRQEGQLGRVAALSPWTLAGRRGRQLQGRRTCEPRSSRVSHRGHGELRRLLPTIRFGAFGSKGLKETDVAGLTERVGPAAPPGGQPIIASSVSSTPSIRSAAPCSSISCPRSGGSTRIAAFLNRHAPGAGNTAGAAVRVSRQILPWLVGMAQFDINESFVGPERGRYVTVGVTIGRWPKPADWSNPVNPLGTLVPRAALRSLRSDSLIGRLRVVQSAAFSCQALTMRLKPHGNVALLVAFCWLASAPLSAQLQTGRLLGMVLDQQHAAVPGATVTVHESGDQYLSHG